MIRYGSSSREVQGLLVCDSGPPEQAAGELASNPSSGTCQLRDSGVALGRCKPVVSAAKQDDEVVLRLVVSSE